VGRWDRVRSAVQNAASRVKERADDSTFAKIRRAVSEIGSRRARVPVAHLRRVAMEVPGVTAVSLAIVPRDEGWALGIDLDLSEGRQVRAELVPLRAQFARGGAKELSFTVTPEASAAEPAMRELTGAFAAAIARMLWSASLPPATSAHESGLVDREGTELRIDLRTVPAVRSAMARGPAVAMLLEVITPEAIEVDADGLVIRINLPQLTP